MYTPVAKELAQVEERLSRISKEGVGELAGMLDYVAGTGGKRVRPAITLLAARFQATDYTLPIIMATAVELLHVATLIHDDTVDNSSLRRGKATVGSLWGRNAAVLLGDYVFATSATFVCDTGNVRAIRRFSETIMELSSGELLEYFNTYNWQQKEEDYCDRIYRKTASLFSTAAETGALLSGAPEPAVQSLKDYGRHIGMAFQIVDDILDVLGSTDEIGKPVGHDLLQGVLTLPTIKFIEQYPDNNPVKALFEEGNANGHLDARARHDSQLRHRGGVLRRGARLLRQGEPQPQGLGRRLCKAAPHGPSILRDGAHPLALPDDPPTHHRHHHLGPLVSQLP